MPLNNDMPFAPCGRAISGASDSGTQKRMASGGNFQNYAISFTVPTTAGNGFGSGLTATSVTITGAVVQTGHANAASATYSNTVDFTIAP